MSENNIPARLSEIIENFQFVEGWEKVELLLEYADKMPPLSEKLREEHDTGLC